MGGDDRFKRYQEAGADFLGEARKRAEEFLEELAKVGDTTQKQAHGALDELVEGRRKGTEQLLASIRKEVTSQLSLLGLATKDDLEALERRLTGGVGPATGTAGSATKDAAAKMAPAKKAPATQATAKKAPATQATAKKAAPKKAPAKKSATKTAAVKTPPQKAAGEA